MNPLGRLLCRLVWPRVPARQLGARLPDYLRRRVAPALGFEDEPIELETPESGAIALVRRWKTRLRGDLYVRAWPWDPGRTPAREQATVAWLFVKAGLKTPETLFVDDSLWTMRRWRLEATVETAAHGEPLDAARPDHRAALERLAPELGLLHQQTAPAWGKPWRPENERAQPRAYWAERLRKFRLRLTPETCGLGAEQLRQGLDQLERRLEALRLRWPVLLHGDIHGGHLFVSPVGALTWIDFGASQYGLAEQDLADVRAKLIGPAAFEGFLERYQAVARREPPIDPEAITTFGLLRLWEGLNSRVTRRRHRLRRRPAPAGGPPSTGLARLDAERRRIEARLRGAIAALEE